MPNLLECLLHGHKDINKEAVKLYDKAQKNLDAQGRAEGRDMGGDDFGEELERLIIEDQLPKINLLDEDQYHALRERVNNWYVPYDGMDIAAKCAPVSSILVNRLEHFRQLQQKDLSEKCSSLLSGCIEYRQHLQELQDAETMKPQSASRDGYAPLENKKIQKAEQQIEAVNLLIDELSSGRSSFTKLQNFQIIYQANKKIIESGHDSAAEQFKKVMHSILLLLKGKAKQISGLWKTKGKELTDHVQTAIKPPYKKV